MRVRLIPGSNRLGSRIHEFWLRDEKASGKYAELWIFEPLRSKIMFWKSAVSNGKKIEQKKFKPI